MSHSLIIGGTGMLRGVCLHLARTYDTVSVIARESEGLESLAREASAKGGQINPIHLDCRNNEQLIDEIEEAADRFGSIDLAVAWIHSSAPQATAVIAKTLESLGHPCRYFDILGSAAADPSKSHSVRRERFGSLEHLSYRRVVLGFVIEGDSSRWLTNDEICAGIIDAIGNDRTDGIVGVVEPWDKRP